MLKMLTTQQFYAGPRRRKLLLPLAAWVVATSTTEAGRGEVDLFPFDSLVIATHLGHIRAPFFVPVERS